VPITIPDEVLTSPGLTESELRQELAIALFRGERLTLAQAAKLAEQTQPEFQGILTSRRIPIRRNSASGELSLAQA
jgi:predicted HTH domain antitoxin